MKWIFVCLSLAFLASQINAQDCVCPSNSLGAPSCLSPNDTCGNAIAVWRWAATVCASPNPNCSALCNIVRNVNRPYNPSLNQLTVFNATYDWANLYTGAALTTIVNNGATFGELVYTANTINKNLVNVPPATEPVFLEWQTQWKALGDRLYAAAEGYRAADQDYSARNAYLRSSTAYWLGLEVASRFGLGPQLYESEVSSFDKALNLFDYDCHHFSIPYTQEGVNFNITGVHCFPSFIGRFNWVVFVGGLDFPFEHIWTMFAQGALNRGYAVTFFDGPGQDAVADVSRFVKNYDVPTLKVIKHLKQKYPIRLRNVKIAVAGASFGGYLVGEICASMSDEVDACIINPPMWNTPAIANNLVVAALFTPFLVAAQAAPQLIPSGYIPYLANANNNVFVPLVTQCGPQGKGLVGATLANAPRVVVPTLLHICERFAPLPHHAENITYTLSNCGYAYEYIQSFVNTRLSNITVPVLILAGRNDTLESGQEQSFFDQLNPTTKAQSELYFFEPNTGGAMHVQVGAQQVLDEKMYGWLESKGIKGADWVHSG